jgi:hypothetical protein
VKRGKDINTKEMIMSRLDQYLEAIKKEKSIPPNLDEVLERQFHNLDRDELIDMIEMYNVKISKQDIKDSDDDELIDYLLNGLKQSHKIKLYTDKLNEILRMK